MLQFAETLSNALVERKMGIRNLGRCSLLAISTGHEADELHEAEGTGEQPKDERQDEKQERRGVHDGTSFRSIGRIMRRGGNQFAKISGVDPAVGTSHSVAS